MKESGSTGRTTQFPGLPGTAMPRSTGMLIVLGTILGVEILRALGVLLPSPTALLLLAIACATYLDGVRIGVIASMVLVLYEVSAYIWRGAVLADLPSPFWRAAGLTATAIVTVGLVAAFRRRLEALLLKERRLLEEAESQRNELASALSRVERAHDAIRFQARLLDTVGHAVIATDRTGRIVYWNEPAGRLFGTPPARALGRSIVDVMPDSPGMATMDRIGRGASWSGETDVRRPDGSVVTVLVNDEPIRDDDEEQSNGLVRIATDLTKRSRVERGQRLLADAGSLLAASMNYETTVRSVARLCVPTFADCCLVDVVDDDGTAMRLGATHVDTSVEPYLRTAGMPADLGPDSTNPVAEVIRTGLPRYSPRITASSLRELRSSSHADWLRRLGFHTSIIAPLRAGGRTLGAISFYRRETEAGYDQPDLLLAEEIANRAATAIQQAWLFESATLANRSKSDFLAVMSHELRTPLTTITGYTDLMLADVPGELLPKHRSFVERIRLASAHLLSLIEQILVYARLEAGRERMQPERLRLNDVLHDAAALIEPVATERGIRFSVQQVEGELFLHSDRTKLRQILLNLLSNAVKFTDEGEVRLGAVVENGNVMFTVRDTGIGIEAHHLGSIFDPFWQVDQSSTRRAGGAGLGLSVTRRLTRMLGGDVRVASTSSDGTTFTVRLPLRWPIEDNGALRTIVRDSVAGDPGG